MTEETPMAINVPLLRKTLEHIEAHPEEHDQSVWARKNTCGTAFCLAGHAVQIGGQEIDWTSWDGVMAWNTTHGGSIENAAMDLLGLTYTQAGNLFHYENDRADLWLFANQFTNGEIEIPEKYL